MRDVLGRHLTPSAHITSPERLFGRERKLTQIGRAFNSLGRHIFIYGDRGVGKTSLALTAAYLQQNSSNDPVYVLCSEHGTFADTIYAIGCQAIPLKERLEKAGNRPHFSAQFAGFGGAYQPSSTSTANFEPPTDINSAMDIVKYAKERSGGTLVVVIDEFERLTSQQDKNLFAEFINSFSSVDTDVKFILCGIGSTVDELLGAHASAFRKLETVELERLRHDELWKIISSVAQELGVTVEKEILIRIGLLSDGFPHYVHLIGESLFWSMYDDINVVSACNAQHFQDGVSGALERTEAVHKSAYLRATQKTKNTSDYEVALWALADHSNLRRQLSDIYESYQKISNLGTYAEEKRLDRTQFNDRLLRLRNENHGSVIIGHGSGWFSYRENILRGYVRLFAEHRGIRLASDHYIKAQ